MQEKPPRRSRNINTISDKPTTVVSNNNLLHRQLGSKLIPTPNRDDLQRFGTPSRGILQLADRQIRHFAPHGVKFPVNPTPEDVVLGPPLTLEAMDECDRRDVFKRGDESF